MPSESDSIIPLLRDVVRVLDDKKAGDLQVLKVDEQSSITDYLVLATGTSEPHLRALRVELEKVLDARHARIAGMDTGEPGSGWTVVDAYQIMVHLFTAEKREAYGLENLWKDADSLSVSDLLRPPTADPAEKPRATRRQAVRKPAAQKSKPKTKTKKTPAPKKPAKRRKK